MKKLVLFLLTVIGSITLYAQTSTTKKSYKEIPSDRFMIQLANNYWIGANDSVSSRLKSLNRSANVYVMYDKKFKNTPNLSFAIGAGVSTSNMYFDKMNVLITSGKSKVPFIRTDTGVNFKRYKLTTAFVEIPLELKYSSNLENPNKAIKGAIGVKVGTIINAHTKGKGLRNSGGSAIAGFTEKESSKAYFNGTRISATARVGYGHFSLFGAYALTNLFKDGVAPDTKTLQIGLTITGL
jgi:hypothetical protein